MLAFQIIKTIIVLFFGTLLQVFVKRKLQILPYDEEIDNIRNASRLFITMGVIMILYICYSSLVNLRAVLKVKNKIIQSQEVLITKCNPVVNLEISKTPNK